MSRIGRRPIEVPAGVTVELHPGRVKVAGPLGEGYPRQGPYDAILVSGAVPELPVAILDQMAEGGRLAAVIGRPGEPGRATLVQRRGGVASRRVMFDAAVAPLPGFAREPGFVF